MYMAVAFEQGKITCEVGGDGAGLTAPQATVCAHDLRTEYPSSVVAIIAATPSWNGGWPWVSA